MDNKYRQLKEEKKRLQQQFELLRKQYNYYNQFNFNENLGEAISFLIELGYNCYRNRRSGAMSYYLKVNGGGQIN